MKRAPLLRLVLASLAALALLLAVRPASAAVRRFALIMGDDHGDAPDVALRFAESDAQRVYNVLKDLGGFEPVDMVLLRGEDASRAEASLIGLNERVRATTAQGGQAVLLVYYSGHADAEALHMAGSRWKASLLEQLVRGSSATFRLLVVDACRSGAMTRRKGGHAAPPFDIQVDEQLSGEGLVLLTSSAADEDAQESDALEGSFFTHHLVSALLGAADADGDGKVTLEEAYRYAYDATLRSSSQTLAGTQHPTFRYELLGAGKLPLTEVALGQARGVLVFPAGRTYLVLAGSDRGGVVGEVADVARARRLNVRAGRYFVRGRGKDVLFEGEVEARAGEETAVKDDALRRIQYARLVRKGGGPERLSNGVEAAYAFFTPLGNGTRLCQGAMAGYVLHFASLSVGGRLAGCLGGFESDALTASADQVGGELLGKHAWDLPWVTLEVGVSLGAWVLHQEFTTSGVAPARTSGAGSLSVLFAAHLDLGGGFNVFAEAAPGGYLYPQSSSTGGVASSTSAYGPFFSLRQSFGLAKDF